MEKNDPTWIPVDKVKPNPWNPNVQKDKVFNALCENIKEIGMVEPIMVTGEQEDGLYMVISGEHRWEACKALGYDEIPAYIKEDFDEDATNFQTVRMNLVKGEIDPVKFTKLYDKMAETYGEELTKTMMGFADNSAFEQLYVGVTKDLPKEIKDKMNESKKDIKNIDDLSKILNELFYKYGDTLHENFMVFTYGGKMHLWVSMDNDLKNILLDDVVESLRENQIDVNKFFEVILTKHWESTIKEMTDGGIGIMTENNDEEEDEDDDF